MDGPGRELGPGNAVSGTVPQENALNRHGAGSILGMVRLALALPLRGLVRSSLTMTDGNCNFLSNCTTTQNARAQAINARLFPRGQDSRRERADQVRRQP